jgi:hypothetical protein
MRPRRGRKSGPASGQKMLIQVPTELQEVYQRGLAASTFVSQPFWKELERYMAESIATALEALEKARNAEPTVKANLVDRWLITKDLVARIEQFPVAAIEAARELGEERNG